jgi:pyruvate ferredoxin oxidoreductase alpha subunit
MSAVRDYHGERAMKKVLMGDHAVSHGVMLCRAEVISAYPITPQTYVVEEIAEMCQDGRLKARFVMVESEHSALACVIAASAAGSRAFTATSSHGLALMHEMLHWAAGSRLPVVMANVNRTLGPPWNILCDHSDSMAQRDTGWIQFYVESNQETLDTIIEAYRIAERVLLPVMVNLDGFFLSHTAEVVDLPEQGLVDEFLPPYEPRFKLDVNEPHTFGSICFDSNFMRLRYELQQAMNDTRRVAQEVDDAYHKLTGRRYGVVEPYRLEGGKTILVTAGTITSTARVVVDSLRDRGEPVGLLKLRMVRPFPFDEIRALLGQAERVAVIDRSVSYGLCGGLASEVRSALYDSGNGRPPVFGFVAGLGGQDVVPADIEHMVDQACSLNCPPQEDMWIGVRS